MFQETGASWDLSSCPPPLSTGDRLFVFVILGMIVVAAAKFSIVFHMARVFRRASSPDVAAYRNRLKHFAQSMLQWIFVPFFAWGFLTATRLYQLSRELLMERNSSTAVSLFSLSGILINLEMAILVSFLIFLCRWFALILLRKAESI